MCKHTHVLTLATQHTTKAEERNTHREEPHKSVTVQEAGEEKHGTAEVTPPC